MRPTVLVTLVLLLTAIPAGAQTTSTYTTGYVTNVDAQASGLYVLLNDGGAPPKIVQPLNCNSTNGGWMFIPDTYRTMIASTLIARSESLNITIYTSGVSPTTGYCTITQVVE